MVGGENPTLTTNRVFQRRAHLLSLFGMLTLQKVSGLKAEESVPTTPGISTESLQGVP